MGQIPAWPNSLYAAYSLTIKGQIAGNLIGDIGMTMKHGVELESALFTIGTDGEDRFLNSFKAVLMPMRGIDVFLQSFVPADRKAA